MNTTSVRTDDLWAALDALDAVPEAQHTDWFKRLEEAANTAIRALLLNKGFKPEQVASPSSQTAPTN